MIAGFYFFLLTLTDGAGTPTPSIELTKSDGFASGPAGAELFSLAIISAPNSTS